MKVGEVMGSVTPTARPKPCAKAVLPAPMSPDNTMTSPTRANSAIAVATRWVPSSEVTEHVITRTDATEGFPSPGTSGGPSTTLGT